MGEVYAAIGAVLIVVLIVAIFLYKRKKIGGGRRQGNSTTRSTDEELAEQRRRYGVVKPEDQVQQPRRSMSHARDDTAAVFVISQEDERGNQPSAPTDIPMQPRRVRNPPQQRLTDEQIIGLDPPPSYDIAITEAERERGPQVR
ncbi:uncharacterized protein LOC129792008 [Lutzomyia longipalpis]|uniref:Uncharacterized protein n=2 Tax=Lutzomyia longipalpis TaxID=7200 RepID=A0A1B0CAU7_LUTLO|nr:uncharacterized protein LOC129792008 [Lutzomyia longipalpis]